jgi:hypothetical protein
MLLRDMGMAQAGICPPILIPVSLFFTRSRLASHRAFRPG